MQNREVIPMKQKLALTLELPGSKSITNRALLCAALASGKSRLYGTLKSDDAEVMIQALKKLGVKVCETKGVVEITGNHGLFEGGERTLDLHNAGTATRFLTAVACLRKGSTIITGNERMQQRPITDLADGLRQLGAEVTYLKNEGCPPIRIRGGCLKEQAGRYKVRICGDKSSQYFSALLMLGAMLGKPLVIEVAGDLVSRPYIDTTIAVMKAFGAKIYNNGYRSFVVSPQPYRSTHYIVEGDASAATYFSALSFLHGGQLTFTNLDLRKSIQGDARFLKALETLKKGSSRTIDMQEMPDAAMTLAVCAVFAKGTTKITGLSTLRIKETDRLTALKTELTKVGVRAAITDDSITVSGKRLEESRQTAKGFSLIETYNDHRMAMCFAVMGTKLPGIVIENPDCTKKTYPEFWKDLERAYLTPIRLGRKNLLLTGMRCSGKTRHGKRIARMLGRKFVDLDSEIEKAERMSIKNMVKLKGWPYFRKIEHKICSKFAHEEGLVISSGGGIVLDPENMKVLKKNSVNIFLFADPDVLIKRIIKKQGGRPSLTGKNPDQELRDIWKKRRELYLEYADCVWDNTSGLTLYNKNLALR